MAELGRSWSLATSYDIAFLHSVLAALEQAPFVSRPCTAWPWREVAARELSPESRRWLSSVNLLLIEAKCRDDVEDGSAWRGRLGLLALSGKKEQAARILQMRGFPLHLISELPERQSRVERAAHSALDSLSLPTSQMLGEVFAHLATMTNFPSRSPALRRLGLGLGAALYLKDALEDLDSDTRLGRFNALSASGCTRGQALILMEREVTRARFGLAELALPELAHLDQVLLRLLPARPEPPPFWQRARQRRAQTGLCEVFLCCGVELTMHACCHSCSLCAKKVTPAGEPSIPISSPLPAPSLICPACDYPMTCTHAAGVEYDECQRCAGLWLDRGELQQLAQAEKLPYQLLHRRPPTDAPQPRTEGTRSCPRCSQIMSVMTVRGVRLDFCSDCQGLFLDHGELSRFLGPEEEPRD